MIISIVYVSTCGRYIAICEDRMFSEYITTNKRGRSPGWNELNDENKWVRLGILEDES